VVRIDKGPFQLEEGPGPEYETVASFGTMLLIDNLEAVAKQASFAIAMA
jgi:aldehyde:ferredoxin oxidoreductase